MSKPVSTVLGAVLLCSTTLVFAQAASTPEEVVMVEAARREGLTRETREILNRAAQLQARGDIVSASKLYQDAVDLTARIGTNVDAERRLAIDGLIQTRLELARRAQARGDLLEAQNQVDAVLKVAPNNEAALMVKKDVEKRLAEEVGKRPDPETISQLNRAQEDITRSNTLVQDGKILFEAKRLVEAEAKLRQAIRLNPSNKAASYYLDLIMNERFQNASERRESVSKERILEVVEEWTEPSKGLNLPTPNPAARTNLVHTSRRRQAIYSKLERIKLNQVEFDGLPLGEVLKYLYNEAQKRDPDQQGINFMLAPNADPVPRPPPQLDPNTGLPLPEAFGEEAADLAGITIRIQPPLRNISLQEALEAIVKAADRPIKFSVDDLGVIFTPRAELAQQLYTKWFKLDPNTFLQGLQGVVPLSFGTGGGGQGGQGGSSGGGGGFGGGGGGRSGGGGGGFGGGGQGGGQGGFGGGQNQGGSEYVGISMAGGQFGGGQGGQGGFGGGGGGFGGGGGGGGTNSLTGGGNGISFLTVVTPMEQLITLVRNFFNTAGVNLDAPKSVFFHDRLGMLMVRATMQDLDIIEQALQVLNMAPPQVTIEAKFAEISQDDTRALGFDWFLGNTLISNGRMGFQGGSAPSLGFDPLNPGSFPASSPANPTGIFPGPNGGPALLGPGANDNKVTSGLRQSAPDIFTLTGILTDPQFRLVIKALDQRQGVDLLSAPKITTISSRQAQIKVVEVRYIVIDLDLGQTASGGGSTTSVTGGVGTGGGVVGSTIQPITQPFELGPVLDVIPYVAADGYTIQMTIIPTLKEFVGYDTVSAQLFQAQAQSVGGAAAANPLTTTTPLPIFRLRQVVTSTIVWDGQTVVLGGLISENVTKMKDKVPVLGDLPLVGRFFRSESNMTQKKNLVIFVSPKIIDPAGNPMHSEDDLPFAQSKTPPQAPLIK